MITSDRPSPTTAVLRLASSLALLLAVWLVPVAPLQAKNADLSAAIANLSESPASTEPGQADEFPEIVVEGENIHVFWFARHPGGGHKICYRRSPDGGRSWLPTYEFYQQDLAMRDPVISPYDRHMAVVDGTVHIAFGAYGGEGGGWFGQMIYLRSTDDGTSFEAPRVLWSSTGPWIAKGAHVAAADGKLAICYQRQPNWYDSLEAHVLISGDHGATFSDTVAASAGEGGNWEIEDFVFTGDMVGVLYQQAGLTVWGFKGDLYMAVSDDGGTTYRQQLISVLSTNDLHRTLGAHDEHYSQVIACDSGRAHALWLGLDAAGTNTIFYRRSPDGGRTWGAALDLSAGTGIPPAELTRQHTIATEGDLVFALIHTVASKLYLRRSTDGGASFGPAIEVTDPVGESIAGGAWWPVMKRVPTGVAGVTALDIVTTGLKRFRSLDGGQTFQTSATGPLWSLGSSSRPQFASDSAGNTHVICEGSWTWYSTGVFGDLDMLYTRFDALPAAPSGSAQALQMVTLRNAGDGSGAERYDAMLVPDDGSLLPRSAVTIECWAKSQLTTPGQESYYLEKQGPGAGGAWETVLVGHWRSGQADIRVATETDGYVIVGGDPIVDGGWHHLAVTYDSEQAGENLFVYVDGEAIGSAAATGLLKSGRGPLLLGAEPGQRAEGTLVVDDVRIWDHAVSGGDILARKDQALTGGEPGLVAWFPLDGSTRDASSGHAHHGRLLYREGFVAGVNGSPPVAEPVITSATILNGVVGQPLSYSIRSSQAADSFAATALPAGLAIDAMTGLISGTPEAAGISSVALAATGAGGAATLNLTVNIRGAETVVFNNNNVAGVSSNPPQPTTFSLAAATTITYLMDYHYFNGGTGPGTIALRHADGSVYGPWQTEGRIGQGGVSDAYWEVWPMITLPAGTYTVIDSSPATWSWNSQSGNRGITTIRGIENGTPASELLATWAANSGLVGADADPESDPDGDGRANWVEAAVGGHPMRRDLAPLGLVTTMTPGGRHAVAYQASSGGFGVPGSDHVVNGARIVLEVSTSMRAGSWIPSVNLLDVADAECLPNGDGTETVVVPLLDTGSSGAAAPVFARERFSRVATP